MTDPPTWPTQAAVDEAMRIHAELVGRFRALAEEYPSGDPRREAFFAAMAAAENVQRQMIRVLAPPVRGRTVGQLRLVGERTERGIQRLAQNRGRQ